jgi:hypothetical protein
MTSDIFVERASRRGHIRVIGTSDYFALWIGDGCVDVSVPLTPASARVLAELLLAISSPEGRCTARGWRLPAGAVSVLSGG